MMNSNKLTEIGKTLARSTRGQYRGKIECFVEEDVSECKTMRSTLDHLRLEVGAATSRTSPQLHGSNYLYLTLQQNIQLPVETTRQPSFNHCHPCESRDPEKEEAIVRSR